MIINREGKEELFELTIIPELHPVAFQNRVKSLMSSGLDREHAEIEARGRILMELYYDKDGGCFCVESEAVECMDIYNPYTGNRMISEDDLEHDLYKRYREAASICSDLKPKSFEDWMKLDKTKKLIELVKEELR